MINGITLGGLYFLVASGFTLIFGLMRNVNLAHGSIYLLGGYFGYLTVDATGSWLFSFVVAFVVAALLGVILQVAVFRRMEGQDLRQTLVTIGISIVFADLMLWGFGGEIRGKFRRRHGFADRWTCLSSPRSSRRARRCISPIQWYASLSSSRR